MPRSTAGRLARGSIAIVAFACYLLFSPAAKSAEAVASIEDLEGRAYATTTEQRLRTLKNGSKVYEGERVVTTSKATLAMVYTDNTRIVLGPRTRVSVDDYNYKPEADADTSAFSFNTSILQGVARVVTGFIAKHRPRRVRYMTSVGTIGVRGTHFTVEVQGSSATIILLAQADAETANAIEVENQYGRVEIDEAGFGTEIPDANSPPSPPRRMEVSNNMTRILRSVNTTRRVRIPRSPRR